MYCQSRAPLGAFNAYRFPLFEPTYTKPLATAGEEEIAAPVAELHRRPRSPTVAGLRMFSYGLNPACGIDPFHVTGDDNWHGLGSIRRTPASAPIVAGMIKLSKI